MLKNRHAVFCNWCPNSPRGLSSEKTPGTGGAVRPIPLCRRKLTSNVPVMWLTIHGKPSFQIRHIIPAILARIGTEDQILRPHFPGHRLVGPLPRPAQHRVLRDVKVFCSLRQTQPHDVYNHASIIRLPNPGPRFGDARYQSLSRRRWAGGLSKFQKGREEVLRDAIPRIMELGDGRDSDWKKGATTDLFSVLNYLS